MEVEYEGATLPGPDFHVASEELAANSAFTRPVPSNPSRNGSFVRSAARTELLTLFNQVRRPPVVNLPP
jgi:hypothetical protein